MNQSRLQRSFVAKLIVLVALLAAPVCPAVAYAHGGNASGGGSRARAAARSRPGTYAIYKIFRNPLWASRFRPASARAWSARSLVGPASIVLRWGNNAFGYRHIKRRHGYSSTTSSLISETVFRPGRIKRESASAVVYTRTYYGDPRLNGDVCTFKVVENPKQLSDHLEKGIITAYDDCHTFFF